MAAKPNFRHIKTHTIRGRKFLLRWRRPKLTGDYEPGRVHGQCDHPCSPGKCLYIYPSKDSLELLDTAIHEVAHGSFFDLEETAVEEYCAALKRLLVRMGIQVSFNPRTQNGKH